MNFPQPHFVDDKAHFSAPIELLFTEDWNYTGVNVEGITDSWIAHNKAYSAAPLARLWPHQRLFEYFREGFSITDVKYAEWHQANFRLRGIEPPLDDERLLAFRHEQFSQWEYLLRQNGPNDENFSIPVKFHVPSKSWMLLDGHHRSAFLRISGIRWLNVVADKTDWDLWLNQNDVAAVGAVISQQHRSEFYTPILHPSFKELRPLRDFAYKSRLDHILEFLGPRVRKGRIVDIGSNAGFFSHHFSREGFEVVGYDPDRNHHDLAVALSKLYQLPTTFLAMPFQEADSSQIFDGALLLTVLYHFLGRSEHVPLLRRLDAIVADYVIWESGSHPQAEKDAFKRHTKFSSYIQIADTYGTGRARELGMFCTPEFAERLCEAPLTKPTKAIFDYMATGQWLYEENVESVSGAGSTLNYTREFRKELETFLKYSKCCSLFDGPCGDFNWMKEVRLPSGMQYFGGDIASDLIAANRKNYARSDRLFFEIDMISQPLPHADIWLCRDCLFHLSYEDIFQVLRNGINSSFKFFLITSHMNEKNEDGVTGSFRELNIRLAPFNFPEPIYAMRDFIDGFPPRFVGVWSREQVLGTICWFPRRTDGVDAPPDGIAMYQSDVRNNAT